ncbi:DNA-binding transcriptional MerR regulator [Microbacterium sp. AK009]|uniref:MerR family transcriptional regulator n=1 Tax=Microbacterium sp. AK009 TaxID=2723068 RepID=UPI0015C6FCD8|nr:MerR family transcriptional regulator [Microbacterium sp. AK009]NYF18021.1 DNA-binding transcriptional MerR regulator [Microbacterium sp. AK009]
MRSAELARLAGVTVRALRHYHQVGVLAEPPRGSNGYRDYDVHDLVRLLRIRRLASLGVALERMPDLLDASSGGAALLDELDAELAEQIARLTEQRALIGRVRALDAPPDVPVDLAPFLAFFAAAGAPSELTRIDRDQSILLAHLLGDDRMPELVRFYERLSDPATAPAVVAFSERFAHVGPHTSEEEAATLVSEFLRAFGPLLTASSADALPTMSRAGEQLIAEYTGDVLNPTQRRVLADLAAAVEDRLA